MARFWSILARFWTLRGSILEVFRRFFDAFALELANSLEEEATSGKPVKTIGKPQVFTRFQHVRLCAHDANIDRKSFRTRFSTESRDGSPSKAASFELRSLKMVRQGLSGASLGALEWLLWRSWTLLQRSWALLGRSWGALEALLGRSWALLGAPGTLLGRSLTLLGDLGSILEPPRVDFGASGVDFGASWHRFPVVARARQQRNKSGTSRALGNNDATTSRVGSSLCTPRI